MLLHWCKSLFADELWVVIQPDEILLQRVSRKLSDRSNPQVLSTKIIECAHKLLDKNNDENDWAIFANYLKQALNEPMCQGAMSRLVLSNHFVRYAVIPWNKELSTHDERLAYTKHSFALAFGESIKDWDLRISQSAYGQSAIASAVDFKLLTKIHEIFDELNMPLQAVSPQLMLTINHVFNEVETKNLIQNGQKADAFWIVTIQHQRLCLVLYDQSGWRLVKNMVAEQDVMRQVKTMMHREIVNGNLQQDLPVMVYWPEFNNDINAFGLSFIQISPCFIDMQNNLKSIFKQDLAFA